MAWKTKLTETDYSVHRTGSTVVFRDNRNKRAFQLSDELAQQIRSSIGFLQPDSVWVRIAISNGLIPHPFDEYV